MAAPMGRHHPTWLKRAAGTGADRGADSNPRRALLRLRRLGPMCASPQKSTSVVPVSRSVAAVRGLPARSVAAVEVVHCSVVVPVAVPVAPLGEPRVTETLLPVSVMLDAVKVVFAVTYFLPEVTLPRATWVVLVGSKT